VSGRGFRRGAERARFLVGPSGGSSGTSPHPPVVFNRFWLEPTAPDAPRAVFTVSREQSAFPLGPTRELRAARRALWNATPVGCYSERLGRDKPSSSGPRALSGDFSPGARLTSRPCSTSARSRAWARDRENRGTPANPLCPAARSQNGSPIAPPPFWGDPQGPCYSRGGPTSAPSNRPNVAMVAETVLSRLR